MFINLFIKLIFFVFLLFSCNNRVEVYDTKNKNVILKDTIGIERIKIPTH